MSNQVMGGVLALALVVSAIGAPIVSASNDHKDNNGRGNAYGHSKQEDKHGNGQDKKTETNESSDTHGKNKNETVKNETVHHESKKEDAKPANNGNGKDNHVPVTICHKTGSKTNPYVIITVDDDAITKRGHDHHHDGGDIIPPFTDDEGNSYPGKNWTSAGYDACKKQSATPVKENNDKEKPADAVKEDKSDDKETPTPAVVKDADNTPTKPAKATDKAETPASLPNTGGFSTGPIAMAAAVLAALTAAISYAVRSKLTKQSQL